MAFATVESKFGVEIGGRAHERASLCCICTKLDLCDESEVLVFLPW